KIKFKSPSSFLNFKKMSNCVSQDIQYADIDYMDGRRDFTIDPVNFRDLPALVDEVKKGGLRFVIILDPAIANDYATYERGVALSVYAEWA
ncbi:Lysosomal alpha-glucosidase, partial [Daphnia magna]